MYIDPLTGSTMFREFIGTVPQEQNILRLSEHVRTYSDRERTPQPCRIRRKTEQKLTKSLPPPSNMCCDQESGRSW